MLNSEFTEEQLNRLKHWIDQSKAELRMALAMSPTENKTDCYEETRGFTRGELIVRWIEVNGL